MKSKSNSRKSKSVRAVAALVVDEVLTNNKSLDMALGTYSNTSISLPDQALLQELGYGCLRWYHQNYYLTHKLLSKPLKPKDNLVLVLLLLGLYQLQHTRVPQYAAIAATVEAARELNLNWATGLINAILRNFIRQQEKLLLSLKNNTAADYSHPKWLVDLLQHNWPQQWQEILLANNQRPPFNLRVNLRAITREAYLNLLTQNNIEAVATPHSPAGIFLPQPCTIEKLPNFQQGWISVQDTASQLTAELLELKPGLRVLDACAAPGGKLTHILETESKLNEVVAVEIEEKRLTKIRENLQRLHLESTATLICGDVTKPQKWWNGKKFTRILIDAPCSATGVIRRHPDIKVLRLVEDIKNLVTKQLSILEALWPLLEAGGILVYSTCSVLPEENWLNIEQFLAQHSDAQELPIAAQWGVPVKFGRQILPGMDNMDGFYYVKIMKKNY